MRKLVAALAAGLLAALGSLNPAVAQEEGTGPAYTVVTTLEVMPPDRGAFVDAVRSVREAAEAADLDPTFRWEIYNKDNTFYFVSWREAMAAFDDPEAFLRQFEGTPQAETVRQAMQTFQSLHVEASTSVSRAMPDMGYMPDNSAVSQGDHAGVFVISNTPGGASEQEFAESTKGIMRMLGEIGYRYPVFVSWVMLGDEKVQFVIPFDSPANFYGEHSVYAALQQAEMMDEWESHMEERNSLLLDTESMMLFRMPELGYRPDLAVEGESSM